MTGKKSIGTFDFRIYFCTYKRRNLCSCADNSGGGYFPERKGKAVAIPAEQIERLRFVENQADEPLEISYEDIPAGTLVEVVRGKLAGFQGEMVQIRDKYRIVLRLEKLGCALITVAASCVEKVKNYSKKGYVWGFLFIFVTH